MFLACQICPGSRAFFLRLPASIIGESEEDEKVLSTSQIETSTSLPPKANWLGARGVEARHARGDGTERRDELLPEVWWNVSNPDVRAETVPLLKLSTLTLSGRLDRPYFSTGTKPAQTSLARALTLSWEVILGGGGASVPMEESSRVEIWNLSSATTIFETKCQIV